MHQPKKKKMSALRRFWSDAICFPKSFVSASKEIQTSMINHLMVHAKMNRPDLGADNPAIWAPFFLFHVEKLIREHSQPVVFSPKLLSHDMKTPGVVVQHVSNNKNHAGSCGTVHKPTVSKL
jgi:hypothetical protein